MIDTITWHTINLFTMLNALLSTTLDLLKCNNNSHNGNNKCNHLNKTNNENDNIDDRIDFRCKTNQIFIIKIRRKLKKCHHLCCYCCAKAITIDHPPHTGVGVDADDGHNNNHLLVTKKNYAVYDLLIDTLNKTQSLYTIFRKITDDDNDTQIKEKINKN